MVEIYSSSHAPDADGPVASPSVVISRVVKHQLHLRVCSPMTNGVFPINWQENFVGLVR